MMSSQGVCSFVHMRRRRECTVSQTGLESHRRGLHAAWVIYDCDQKRVLAAWDASGSVDMHWGTTDDGRFMFGSDPIDLTECNPTSTPLASQH